VMKGRSSMTQYLPCWYIIIVISNVGGRLDQ
jgi:hypothetical protein